MSDSGQIYLEYTTIGNAMEVRAIDAQDGLEIAFMAPVNTPESEIIMISRQKLNYVRRKQCETRKAEQNKPNRPDGRRGIIV